MKPTPVRLQRSRRKGSRLTSPNGLPIVCVSRPSVFGNPWSVKESLAVRICGNPLFDQSPEARPVLKQMVVDEFRRWLVDPIWDCDKHQRLRSRRDDLLLQLPRLRGKNLACWCKLGDPCHGDVLLELANGAPSRPEKGATT